MGRKIPRKSGAHSEARSHDWLAKAEDLELLVLRLWQHETCDPYHCGCAEALPRFLDAGGLTHERYLTTAR
jgi:hypothetical protein